MTTMDGGNADIAGANICPPIRGHKKADTKKYLLKVLLIGFFLTEP